MSGYVQPDVEAQNQPTAQPQASTSAGAPSGNMATNNTANAPSIWEQSSHPVALLFLFLFRGLAIATYLLSGFFSTGFVFSTVVVVLFLSADFWTVKNGLSSYGRVLVGLRFWNQVDESGASYWVFESKDTSGQPNNPVDQKMFWAALYSFPVAWVGLLFVGLLKFNLTFIPIVILALVFNVTNAVGFTYADRDAKRRWATGIAAQGFSMGGLSGSLVSGLGRAAMGKVFG